MMVTKVQNKSKYQKKTKNIDFFPKTGFLQKTVSTIFLPLVFFHSPYVYKHIFKHSRDGFFRISFGEYRGMGARLSARPGPDLAIDERGYSHSDYRFVDTLALPYS